MSGVEYKKLRDIEALLIVIILGLCVCFLVGITNRLKLEQINDKLPVFIQCDLPLIIPTDIKEVSQ